MFLRKNLMYDRKVDLKNCVWSFSGVRDKTEREHKFIKLLVKPLYMRLNLFHSYYLEARKGREKVKRTLQAKICPYIFSDAARKRNH